MLYQKKKKNTSVANGLLDQLEADPHTSFLEAVVYCVREVAGTVGSEPSLCRTIAGGV